MPFSESTFDQRIAGFIDTCKFKTYLDIGAGTGKYGRIIREIKRKEAYIIAVEPDVSYIKKYRLKSIYNQVIDQKIENYICGNPDFVVEMAIIGDCLEHLKKSDGIDLIHYLVYRTKAIIIVFPSKYIQFSYQGHLLEAHNSVWSEEDFGQFQHEYIKEGFMNLVFLRGFLDDTEALIERGSKEKLAKRLAGNTDLT